MDYSSHKTQEQLYLFLPVCAVFLCIPPKKNGMVASGGCFSAGVHAYDYADCTQPWAMLNLNIVSINIKAMDIGQALQ